MLIIQKMEVIKLSSNEEIIKNFILENKEQLKNLTLKQIAAKIYVSPVALVVFAKKMGYSGWNQFKEDFISLKKWVIQAGINLKKILF